MATTIRTIMPRARVTGTTSTTGGIACPTPGPRCPGGLESRWRVRFSSRGSSCLGSAALKRRKAETSKRRNGEERDPSRAGSRAERSYELQVTNYEIA